MAKKVQKSLFPIHVARGRIRCIKWTERVSSDTKWWWIMQKDKILLIQWRWRCIILKIQNEICLSSPLFTVGVVFSLRGSNLCNLLFCLDGVIDVCIWAIFALFRKQNSTRLSWKIFKLYRTNQTCDMEH